MFDGVVDAFTTLYSTFASLFLPERLIILACFAAAASCLAFWSSSIRRNSASLFLLFGKLKNLLNLFVLLWCFSLGVQAGKLKLHGGDYIVGKPESS